MGRIGIVLLFLLSVAARADELSTAISYLKKSDERSLYLGAELVRRLGPAARKASPQLIKNLKNADWGIREAMKDALVAVGSDNTPLLLKTLKKSKSATQRLAVAEVLAKLGRDTAKWNDDLVALLDDPDAAVRDQLATLLAASGTLVTEALVEALGERSDDQRAGAALALAKIGPAAVPACVAGLEGGAERRRAAAAEALGAMGPKAAAAARPLVALLKDPDPEVRRAGTRAVGRIRAEPDLAVPAIVYLLADADPGVRDAAVVAAADFGAPAAAPLVVALHGTSSDAARRALVRMGKPALEALQAGLASADAVVREHAVRALGEMGPFVKIYLDSIRPLLADDAPAVRCAAAVALARRNPPRAAGEILDAATDSDPSVRAAVVRALGATNPSDAVLAAVRAAAADKDARVQLAAAAALWDLGEKSDVVDRARALLAGDDADLRDAAGGALQPMGRAAEAALPDLIAAVERHASLPLVDALGAIAAAHGNGLLERADRFKHAPKATREAIERALAWLDRFQDKRSAGVNDKDGRWDSKRFVQHAPEGAVSGVGQPLYSAGVTGLALSAFLAVGRADHPAATEGLGYLLGVQAPSGLYNDLRSQHFLIDHAFATIAMCEAWIVTGDPRYRRSARRAIDACLAAQNPGLGWRYEPRGGENDTNVTTVMLMALMMAERGGLAVDPDAVRAGGRWIASMTDGVIGYNIRGGSSARPEGLQERFPPEQSGSMTAAGLFGLALVARHGVEPPPLDVAIEVCRDLPPLWQGGRVDMYFWHWGTLYFCARQAKEWKAWENALEKAALPHQCEDPEVLAGSWDPDGTWGVDGGRVYSTALLALTLATPCRMSDDFLEGKPTGAYADAAKALAKLDKHESPEIRARAALWAVRAGR